MVNLRKSIPTNNNRNNNPSSNSGSNSNSGKNASNNSNTNAGNNSSNSNIAVALTNLQKYLPFIIPAALLLIWIIFKLIPFVLHRSDSVYNYNAYSNEENRRLQDKLDDIADKLESMEAEKRKLQNRIDDYEKSNKSLKKQVTNIQNENRDLQEQAQRQAEDYREMQSQMQKQAQDYRAMQEQTQNVLQNNQYSQNSSSVERVSSRTIKPKVNAHLRSCAHTSCASYGFIPEKAAAQILQNQNGEDIIDDHWVKVKYSGNFCFISDYEKEKGCMNWSYANGQVGWLSIKTADESWVQAKRAGFSTTGAAQKIVVEPYDAFIRTCADTKCSYLGVVRKYSDASSHQITPLFNASGNPIIVDNKWVKVRYAGAFCFPADYVKEPGYCSRWSSTSGVEGYINLKLLRFVD